MEARPENISFQFEKYYYFRKGEMYWKTREHVISTFRFRSRSVNIPILPQAHASRSIDRVKQRMKYVWPIIPTPPHPTQRSHVQKPAKRCPGFRPVGTCFWYAIMYLGQVNIAMQAYANYAAKTRRGFYPHDSAHMTRCQTLWLSERTPEKVGAWCETTNICIYIIYIYIYIYICEIKRWIGDRMAPKEREK